MKTLDQATKAERAIFEIARAKLGLTRTTGQEAVNARILMLTENTVARLKNVHGIEIKAGAIGADRLPLIDLAADLVVWEFSNHDGGALPRFLRLRLHEAYLQSAVSGGD